MKQTQKDRLKSAIVTTTGVLIGTTKSPDEVFGELFADVEEMRMYEDGKTFVDMIPKQRVKQIQREYAVAKKDPNFNLRDFVTRHFYDHSIDSNAYRTDPNMSIREHIATLWDVLERRNRRERGSLIALPHAYVVPGGRFSEQYYWDSYFTMIGLATDERWDAVDAMVKNSAYMLRKFGFIPTANRTYYLSRSQPPFFSHMVRLLARNKGHRRTLARYLPYMILEYRFWMKGRHSLGKREHKAFARVVEMPNGFMMNRYYDNKTTPRPESLRNDIVSVDNAPNRDPSRLYLHLRAAAESGWDFSSRWFSDPKDIRTIHTADIIPVDLNCLLYQLEETIAETYRLLMQPLIARRFQTAADNRARSIQQYCWDDSKEFYYDYNFHLMKSTDRLTLAGVFPLYAKIATNQQANAVAKRLHRDFLKPGGLQTTLINNGQQWDGSNGWAPLHWIVIEGLRNYGYYQLAEEIKQRWIKTNLAIFTKQRKLVEKYDVCGSTEGSGGEYPLQDGFGWTNGVLAALLDEDISIIK